MLSLFDSLSGNTNTSINKTNSDSGDFTTKLGMYRDNVVNEYQKSNVDLNESIAKIAKSNNLNDDQIQRVVEESNTQVYLLKYAEMKRYPTRNVIFPIAKVATVKDIVENGVKKVEPTIEKKASWDGDGKNDSLNFLNCSTHETMGMAPEKSKDIKDVIAEKLAFEINSAVKELEEKRASFTSNVYTIADALIKYDRANSDAQNIFETMCKEASIHKADQCIIKSAVDQKISQMKEYRLVPENYAFTVSLIDIEKEADEFSLGQYSLSKHASVSASNAVMPIIVTDNGNVIRQIRDLVGMARNIQRDKEDIKTAEGKTEKYTKLSK